MKYSSKSDCQRKLVSKIVKLFLQYNIEKDLQKMKCSNKIISSTLCMYLVLIFCWHAVFNLHYIQYA